MGKYYSQKFESKKDDTQISGEYYHITGQNSENLFSEPYDNQEQEFVEDEEYHIQEHSSAKDFLKSKTRNLLGFR
ncbi:MAG TPA: hypothetical protein GX531_03580 [Methanothermobacter sp.]|nr:hypothetical protein [Methanothermobacter sp.]